MTDDPLQVRHNGSEEGAAFVEHYLRTVADCEKRERVWLAQIQDQYDPALVHPDDGWVDRKRNTIHPCYPQYRRVVSVGDTMILGDSHKWRVVRCTSVIVPRLRASEDSRTYGFEENL